MKVAICNRQRIQLIEIRPQDLTGHEPLIAYLEATSRGYRRKSKK